MEKGLGWEYAGRSDRLIIMLDYLLEGSNNCVPFKKLTTDRLVKMHILELSV